MWLLLKDLCFRDAASYWIESYQLNMLPVRMMTEEVVAIALIEEVMTGHLIGGRGHQALTKEREEVLIMELALALLPIGEREAVLNMEMAQAAVLGEYTGVLNMGIVQAAVLVEYRGAQILETV